MACDRRPMCVSVCVHTGTPGGVHPCGDSLLLCLNSDTYTHRQADHRGMRGWGTAHSHTHNAAYTHTSIHKHILAHTDTAATAAPSHTLANMGNWGPRVRDDSQRQGDRMGRRRRGGSGSRRRRGSGSWEGSSWEGGNGNRRRGGGQLLQLSHCSGWRMRLGENGRHCKQARLRCMHSHMTGVRVCGLWGGWAWAGLWL